MEFYQPNNIYKEQTNISDDLLKTEFYTLSGQEDVLIDGVPAISKEDNRVYAKKIQKKDGSFKCMIRTSSNGKLFNPVSIIGEEKQNGFLDRVCKSNERFRTVNEKVFNFYLQFLTSKNLAFFYNAEREAE